MNLFLLSFLLGLVCLVCSYKLKLELDDFIKLNLFSLLLIPFWNKKNLKKNKSEARILLFFLAFGCTGAIFTKEFNFLIYGGFLCIWCLVFLGFSRHQATTNGHELFFWFLLLLVCTEILLVSFFGVQTLNEIFGIYRDYNQPSLVFGRLLNTDINVPNGFYFSPTFLGVIFGNFVLYYIFFVSSLFKKIIGIVASSLFYFGSLTGTSCLTFLLGLILCLILQKKFFKPLIMVSIILIAGSSIFKNNWERITSDKSIKGDLDLLQASDEVWVKLSQNHTVAEKYLYRFADPFFLFCQQTLISKIFGIKIEGKNLTQTGIGECFFGKMLLVMGGLLFLFFWLVFFLPLIFREGVAPIQKYYRIAFICLVFSAIHYGHIFFVPAGAALAAAYFVYGLKETPN